MASRTLSYDSIADELMTKASRARARKRANAILERMTLDELRKDRKMTQGRLALAMKIEQSEVTASTWTAIAIWPTCPAQELVQ
jgi:DNA-binding transcriptional regulator YiaG